MLARQPAPPPPPVNNSYTELHETLKNGLVAEIHRLTDRHGLRKRCSLQGHSSVFWLKIYFFHTILAINKHYVPIQHPALKSFYIMQITSSLKG